MEFDRVAAEADFARILLPLGRRWRLMADRALAEFGLSDATGWLFIHVARMGDQVPQSELALALDISSGSLVRLVDQLEQAGLVVREVDPADRRVNRVTLTEAGHALIGRIEPVLTEIRRDVLDGISDEDLRRANAVLASVDVRVSAEVAR
jgi:MarR family transcriptional regulator, transcriptional regulator for hemolysin